MAAKSGPNDPGGIKPREKVRQLQRRLWAAAKRSPGRRFHALYDHISRSDVLLEAWRRVRANKGAAGVDALTLAEVEQYGVERFLEELGVALREGKYRAAVVLRRYIADEPCSPRMKGQDLPVQQGQQEPDDGGKDLRASSQLSQFLDPVQQLLSILVELFEGDHGPRLLQGGGGRARNVEAVREGAVAAHLIAQTVVVRPASFEEARGHLSRLAPRPEQRRIKPPDPSKVMLFQGYRECEREALQDVLAPSCGPVH